MEELKELDWFKTEDLPGEIWKPIKDCPLYLVSDKCRVKRKAFERFFLNGQSEFYPEKIIKAYKCGDGYYRVSVKDYQGKRKGFILSRVVAEAFIPNPDNLPIVVFKNEDRSDVRLENLKWGTYEAQFKYMK